MQHFPAAHAVPITVCPSTISLDHFASRIIDDVPTFPDWCLPGSPEFDRAADELAWENDRGDFSSDYPGPTWDDDAEPFEPSESDVAELHAQAGDDHDGQFDPNDIEYWSVAEDDFQSEQVREWGDATAHIHEAELAEMGIDPWGHRLPAAIAENAYAGGDWR